MNKILVLASGGLDSSVLLAQYSRCNYEIYVMFADYGQANYIQERASLKKVMKRFNIDNENFHEIVVKLPWSNSSTVAGTGNPYVEMRNLIFLSYATSYCEAHEIQDIAVGFIKTEMDYADSSDTFMEDVNILTNRSCGIRVVAPLKDMTKLEVYKYGKLFGVKLRDTFSCNTPVNGKPCGKCGDCKDLQIIVGEGGVSDEDNPFI